jgi:hypothetical protein
MGPNGRSVKINQQEMESLFNLKDVLDQDEAVSQHAAHYQQLGWVLLATHAQDGTDLQVDFQESPEIWMGRLWGAGVARSKINLGVRTGKRSQLLVLEVIAGAGVSILDQYGAWRAECRAALGAERERHFYAWDPSPFPEADGGSLPTEFRWFGEGQMVLVPPSVDADLGEAWRWLSPPWETPPRSPSQSLWRFLQQHLARQQAQPRPEIIFSWQEIYCLAAHHEPLLRAFASAQPSLQEYYVGILMAATAVGITAPEVLLSMLWHAPCGNVPQQPQAWDFMQQLVSQVQSQPTSGVAAKHFPVELFIEHAISSLGEPRMQGATVQSPQTGPPDSHQGRWAQPLQSEPARRTPFSCNKNRGAS